MAPLRGTVVFHPSFQAHHAPVAEGGMTSTCTVTDPNAPTGKVFDSSTGQTTAGPAAPTFISPCRVQLQASIRENPLDTVGQEVAAPPYLVQLPATAPDVQEGWRVRITSSPDDPQMVGRALTVRTVTYGSQRITRDLYCVDE